MKVKCLISGKTWEIGKEDRVSIDGGWYVISFKNRNSLLFHKDNQTMKVEK